MGGGEKEGGGGEIGREKEGERDRVERERKERERVCEYGRVIYPLKQRSGIGSVHCMYVSIAAHHRFPFWLD